MILKYLQYIILTHIKNTYIILCLLSTNTEQNRLYKIFSYCNKYIFKVDKVIGACSIN